MKKDKLIIEIIKLEESKLNIKVDGLYLRTRYNELDKCKKDVLQEKIKYLQSI